MKLHIKPHVEKYKNITNIATKKLAGDIVKTVKRHTNDIKAIRIVIRMFLKKPAQAKINEFLMSCENLRLKVTIRT